MARKTEAKDRKARIEEMRKQQQAADRRRTVLIVGAASVLVVVLVGAVTLVVRNEQAGKDPANVGVATAAASCDPVVTDAASGGSVHVGPGTNQPNLTKVDYKTVPPSSGEHFATPAYPARPFYTAGDRPQLETLVHNLEHGYTVVWYAPSLPQAQQDQLKKLADLVRTESATGGGKFIVSAWDASRGAFPSGKTVAMSHWGAKNGFRQFCGSVSGSAIKTFVQQHPSSDAPEPNGQ